MEIHDIQIEYATMNGFCTDTIDKVRHVKVLPYLSVVQAVEGEYGIALGNDAPLSTGTRGFFVAPAHVQQTIVHNADKASGSMTCRWVFLKIKINGIAYLDDLYRFPTVLPLDVTEKLHDVFDTLFETDDTVERYIGYYRVVQLLLSVGEEKERPLPSYIGNATTYIHQHYADKITVQELADRVNLSSSRFYAVFKAQTGLSPIAYLNNYRLSLAVELLTGTDQTVTQIAASVGIPDAVYFNKLFKKSYQLSPTDYRANYT